MPFQHDRQGSRQIFFDAWKKFNSQQPLEPVEKMLVDIINMHGEYHPVLNEPDTYLDKDYFPEMGETNPFLHMALHMAIKEQVSINQPEGISGHYQQLLKQCQDIHEAEHRIMDCLAEMLWSSQKNNQLPDTTAYLECICKRL